ncbi:MAG: hypothetical protein ACHQD8_00710 [Chitinophagales bacterium]
MPVSTPFSGVRRLSSGSSKAQQKFATAIKMNIPDVTTCQSSGYPEKIGMTALIDNPNFRRSDGIFWEFFATFCDILRYFVKLNNSYSKAFQLFSSIQNIPFCFFSSGWDISVVVCVPPKQYSHRSGNERLFFAM